MNPKGPGKQQLIAAALTALITAAILLFLFFTSLDSGRRTLADASIPEPEELEEEDLYLDPPLVIGGEDVAQEKVNDEPAETPLGEPEKAEVENDRQVTPGENPEPVKVQEKLVTSRKPSSLNAQEPAKTTEKESKISSKMAGSFSAKNGKADGRHDGSGSGGKGSGVSGNVRGRSFLGCPLPKVSLKKTVKVVIRIRVDENGKVIEASVSSGGGASSENQQKCLNSARNARWSKKPGAAPVSGSLTFTLVPKI